MKKIKFLSFVLALTLVISVFSNTVAFAQEASETEITLSEELSSLEALQLNSIYYDYEVDVNNPELTLKAVSSNTSIIDINVKTDENEPGTFYYDIVARGNGTATLIFTASDGTAVSKELTVEGTGELPFTITSDTNDNFALAKGSSTFIKVNFVNDDIDIFTYPVLISKNEEVVKIVLVEKDETNGNYTYRVDVTGNVGQTCDIYMGAYGFIPNKLCTVNISENANLRLDTDCEYICNKGDTYRFVAYTNSATAPVVKTNNSVTSAAYIKKVSGGYEYEMKVKEHGTSLVVAELNGEISSFRVTVNEDDEFPIVSSSESQESITLAKGESHTYRISAMGCGEPIVVGSEENIISSKLVKKEGINYFYKVTADGQPDSKTKVCVMFPNSRYDDYIVNLGSITVKESVVPAPKSDTNNNFSLKQGSSYVFKITGAASFFAGSGNVFKKELISKSGNDSYYRITAIGRPGQAAGFYMAASGQISQKVCVVTVKSASTAQTPKSDTNYNFTVKQGASYTFKITGASGFYAGSSGVFKTELIYKSGKDSYYKITPIGRPGQQAGFYMSAVGFPVKKVCVVTVGQSDLSTITSDTNSNFSISKNASYQFKITASGVAQVNFCTGTRGVFNVTFVRRSGNDFFYKITAIGQPGKETGIYASIPGRTAKKLCVVAISK